MKRNLLLKTMLLLCALMVGSSSAWGQDPVQILSWTARTTSDGTDSYTSGYTYETNKISWKDGYGQDSGTKNKDIISIGLYHTTNKLVTATPASITFTAKLGAGSTKDPLGYNVYACFLDKDGNDIADTEVTVTTKITDKTGSNYSVNMSTTKATDAYGVRIYHKKEDSWNVRYYNFSLSYVSAATPHTLTFSATGGTITATNATTSAAVTSGSSVPEGTTLNIIAAPNSGYIFTGWSSSPSATFGNASNASTTYVMPTADATLTANFEEDNTDYTITLTQTTGGTIEASTSTAKSGTEITLTPTPASDYRFVSWDVKDASNNEVVVANNKFTMPASNVTAKATFAQEYAITINAAENGSVEADPTTGIAGETITLTATPAVNYALNTITVKDEDNADVEVSGTGNTRTFTMPGKAVTVTATFNIPKGSFANPYTVEELVNASANNNIWVRGYIVGDLESNTKPVRTTGFSDTNFVICMTTDPGDDNFNTASKNDVSCIRLEDNIIRVNNKLDTHTYLIGKTVMVYGKTESFYGKMGIKTPKAVLVDNVMTLKDFGETVASDIPGYSQNSNILYYTNSNVTGINIIKEQSSGSCSTTSPLNITDGEPIRVLSDVTVPSITNSRTLSADADAYTWYEPYAYTLPDGNTAYTFTGANGSSLTFEEAGTQTLAANTPYLIIAGNDVNGSVNSSVTVKATPTTNGDGGTQGDWQFVGTYNSMTAAEAATANMWALGSGNKWKYYTSGDAYGVYPRRCYMINSTEKASNNARTFDTVFGGEATYIELVNKTNPEENRIYTLDGKFVGTKKDVLKSGVYVINGKKFMVK